MRARRDSRDDSETRDLFSGFQGPAQMTVAVADDTRSVTLAYMARAESQMFLSRPRLPSFRDNDGNFDLDASFSRPPV